jgi:hypothetical protein
MNKLHNLGLEKILLFCGFTFALTLVGFWQFQHHAAESEKLARVQSGVGTCFARVTQSFTAAMIKEFSSPYLKRDFMAMSDDCLREGTKTAGIKMEAFTKANKVFNELVSEVYWFHEKVIKVLGATAGNPNTQIPMQSITEKYTKVEGLKLDLQDQLDLMSNQFREARLRDEILVGSAFFFFIISLSILGIREVASLRRKRWIENQALSLLNTGHSQTGAMVDQLVQKALNGQGMIVTAQVFTDYHSSVLERISVRTSVPLFEDRIETSAAIVEEISEPIIPVIQHESEIDARKLLTAQAVRLKASMEVQDATIVADPEVVAQLMQAFGQRFASGKVNLTGKREGERYVVCVEASDVCLKASELEYIHGKTNRMDGVDLNVIIAMDIIRETHVDAVIRNRINAEGVIIGAEAVLSFATNTSRTLVNVVRGKKKDLARTLGPSQFN